MPASALLRRARGTWSFTASICAISSLSGGPFDFIIAHGFFSWVSDEAKVALLLFCRRHLVPNGIATISFNLECGWKPRLPVIAKARAIQQAGGGDVVSSLEILKSILDPGDAEMDIVDDMLAKGPAVLACDDFAPVNDPWPLDRFVQAASNAGLRWLGESDPGENLPSVLSEDFLVELRNQVRDPLAYQMAVDEALERKFRSGILCRDDAEVSGRVSLELLMDFFYRATAGEDEIAGVVRSFEPACVAWSELVAGLPGLDAKLVARRVYDGITRGLAPAADRAGGLRFRATGVPAARCLPVALRAGILAARRCLAPALRVSHSALSGAGGDGWQLEPTRIGVGRASPLPGTGLRSVAQAPRRQGIFQLMLEVTASPDLQSA